MICHYFAKRNLKCIIFQLTALSYVQISKDGQLTILGTQEQDTGKYRCVASNNAGSQSVTTELTVGCRYCGKILLLNLEQKTAYVWHT